MSHLLKLDTFCNAVRRVGYDVAMTLVPGTLIAERGPDTVVAEFHDNGTCTLTKNGDNVSLADIVVH